jgi:hypothetical protein
MDDLPGVGIVSEEVANSIREYDIQALLALDIWQSAFGSCSRGGRYRPAARELTGPR